MIEGSVERSDPGGSGTIPRPRRGRRRSPIASSRLNEGWGESEERRRPHRSSVWVCLERLLPQGLKRITLKKKKFRKIDLGIADVILIDMSAFFGVFFEAFYLKSFLS